MSEHIRHDREAMRAYAGIGARRTPAPILQLLTALASQLAEQGYRLRSWKPAWSRAGQRDTRLEHRDKRRSASVFPATDQHLLAPERFDAH